MGSRAVDFIINLKDNLSAGLKSAGVAASEFEEKLERSNKSIENMMKITMAFEIVKKGLEFGKDLLDDYDKMADAQAQIEASLRSTNGVSGETAERLKEQAEALSMTTRASEEQITTAQKLMLTYTNIRGEIADKFVPAAEDMASKLGEDLPTASETLGKSLNNPIRGLALLGRQGIAFTEAQKTLVKHMVAVGDVAGAQKVLMDQLAVSYGGSAEAAAEAGEGPLIIFEHGIEQIKESLGSLIADGLKAIQPYLQGFINILKGAVTWLKEHETLVKYIALALGIAAVAMGVMTAATWALNAALDANPITLVVLAIAALVAGLIYAYNHSETFRKVMSAIGDVLKKVWDFLKWIWSGIMKLGEALEWVAKKMKIFDFLKTIFDGIVAGIDVVKKAFEWLYENTLKPIGELLDKLAAWNAGSTVEELNKNRADLARLQTLEEQANLSDEEQAIFDGLMAEGNGTKAGQYLNAILQRNKSLTTSDAATTEDGTVTANADGTTTATTPTTSEIESRTPKVININITSLIENFTTESNTFGQSIGDLAAKVSEVLIAAVNDANRIQT